MKKQDFFEVIVDSLSSTLWLGLTVAAFYVFGFFCFCRRWPRDKLVRRVFYLASFLGGTIFAVIWAAGIRPDNPLIVGCFLIVIAAPLFLFFRREKQRGE